MLALHLWQHRMRNIFLILLSLINCFTYSQSITYLLAEQTAMIVDNDVEEITSCLIETINTFKSEGVTVRGIDVTSESINQITKANLMIHEARKSPVNKLPSGDYKQEIAEKSVVSVETAPEAASDTKECPRCAETIKAKAKMCRYCNYEFE